MLPINETREMLCWKKLHGKMLKNGKPLPPIETQGSNGSGVKTEQRGIPYVQFSAEKQNNKEKKN